jgi:hypothetical protein
MGHTIRVAEDSISGVKVMSTAPTSGPARHPHPGKIDGKGSGTEARSAGMAQVEVIVTLVLLAGATAGLWFAWRRWLQACPHCGWVVRRVHHGWLRCPRCHKQYTGRTRLGSH